MGESDDSIYCLAKRMELLQKIIEYSLPIENLKKLKIENLKIIEYSLPNRKLRKKKRFELRVVRHYILRTEKF